MEEDLFEEENEDRETSESEDPEVFADDEALVLSNGKTGEWDDDDDEKEEWVCLEDDELEEGLSHYVDTDDTEKKIDFDSDPEEEAEEDEEEDAEAPPWDEEIEMPLHDTEYTSKNLFLIGVISFTLALIGIGLFIFLKPEPITDIPEYRVEEEKKVLFVTKKVPDIRVKDTLPAEKTEKKAEPTQAPVKENAGPVISGEPLTIAPEGTKVDLYTLPDLKDLIQLSEFRDAAIEYHKNVRHVPKAYTLKLEVDCVEGSVQVAYRNGNFDNRMFILPKDIQGKSCFIVFWGLYATKNEALKALSSVPAYFRDQAIKPKLTIIKQYL